jgi:hypothetical protein
VGGGGGFDRRWRVALFKGGRREEESEGGQWGSGDMVNAWSKWGTSRGGSLPTGERRPTVSGPKPVGRHDVRRVRAADRIEGEERG